MVADSSSGHEQMEDELNRFREAWRNEVKGPHAKETRKHYDNGSSPRSIVVKQNRSPETVSDELDTASNTIASHIRESESDPTEFTETNTALRIYESAVYKEAQGNLSEALSLYRQALKKDGNVDLQYRNKSHHLVSANDSNSQPPEEAHGDHFFRPIQTNTDWFPVQDTDDITSLPLQLEVSTLEDARICRDDESLQCWLSVLPDEILLEIFRKLGELRDLQSIERLALTCRKLRSVSSTNSLWRSICFLLFQDYRMSTAAKRTFLTALVSQHAFSWRKMLIEKPRVLFDGCYIATCHYIRPGSSENAFVNVLHMVTYFRYLRLYPNGDAFSWLTTDEPNEVIRDIGLGMLKRTGQRKGLGHGQWHHHGDRLSITIRGRDTPRYDFQMEFRIAAPRRGRWIKLSWLEYYSIRNRDNKDGISDTDPDDSDRNHFGLEHEGPFLFSKVKSYKPSYLY